MTTEHHKTGKPIGELNGPWARLFKFTQIIIVVSSIVIVPWATWATKSINDQDKRIALVEANQLNIVSALDKLTVHIEANNAEISELKQSIVRLETQVATLQRQLERKNLNASLGAFDMHETEQTTAAGHR